MNRAPGAGSIIMAHIDECDLCRSDAAALARVATVLDRDSVALDVAALARQTMAALAPELARRSRAVLRGRIAVAIVLALVPLPLVIVYDAYLLDLLYRVGSMLLPAAVVTYLIGTYIAFLGLLFGGTYAAIPLLLGRRNPDVAALTDGRV